MGFILSGSLCAQAGNSPAQPPATMTDDELASYINGRLDSALKADGYKVSQLCTGAVCDIVIE